MVIFRSFAARSLLQRRSRVFPLKAWLSTQVLTPSTPSPSSTGPDSLYKRVLNVGDPWKSVLPVLEEWVREGKPVEKIDLQSLVKQMKIHRRYMHALEISKWMSDRRYFSLTTGDHALRLLLISKIHGIEHAENHFHNIPKQLNGTHIHSTLLHCYVKGEDIEKAESLFQKMKEQNFLSTFSCNVLMGFYSHIGQYRKVEILFHEMENLGLHPDIFTYNSLIESYVLSLNITEMEKVLNLLRFNDVAPNWRTFCLAAKGYFKSGMLDQALLSINKAEKLIPFRNSYQTKVAFCYLLSLCADVGHKDELYRIWNKCKSLGLTQNSLYLCMISSFLKIEALEDAEQVFKEWDSIANMYDFRLLNLLVDAYCNKGLINKAETLVNECTQKGKELMASTWDRLAAGYFDDDQIQKAIEALKRSLEKGLTWWSPNKNNLTATLEYFRDQKDVEKAEELVSLLRRPLASEVYHCLLKIYSDAGKPASSVLERMSEDGVCVAEEEVAITLEEEKKV